MAGAEGGGGDHEEGNGEEQKEEEGHMEGPSLALHDGRVALHVRVRGAEVGGVGRERDMVAEGTWPPRHHGEW